MGLLCNLSRYLVGGEWLPLFGYFPINIGLFVIIPIDELIFFRGVAQPPTRDDLPIKKYSFVSLPEGMLICWLTQKRTWDCYVICH